MGDDERKCLELAWWLMRETSEGQPGDRTLLAELFKDVAYRLAPVDRRGALEILACLRIKTVLEGVRGAKRADIQALAHLIARISAFAVACRDSVREIELNPVLVHAAGKGCSVVDALIVLEPILLPEA